MFRYRALLVDTEKSYERPVQAHFNNLRLAKEWARAVLPQASEHAFVQFYFVTEIERGALTRKELYDQISGQNLQPAKEETGEPGPAGSGEQ